MSTSFYYERYYGVIMNLMKQYTNQYGAAFCNAYAQYIKSNTGANVMVQSIERRLDQIVPPGAPTTNENVASACHNVLMTAAQAYRMKQQQSQVGASPFGGGGFVDPFAPAPATAPVGGNVMDIDFPQQAAAPARTFGTDTGGQQAAPSLPQHSQGSPFSGITDKDLGSPDQAELDLGLFDRRWVKQSCFGDISVGTKIRFGDSPQISFLKTTSRIPVSDPNLFDQHIRKTYTTDLIGMYWAVSVEYERLYTLPIPVAEYLDLCSQIRKRASEEGYSPELIIQILKGCSQATYEALSSYLVQEFNKLTSRFIRSNTDLKQSIDLTTLNGITQFLATPPVCAATTNPNGMAKFSVITNRFFRTMFSSDNSPKNDVSVLDRENYPYLLHNDAIDMWDQTNQISKYGVPFLSAAEQKEWLKKVADRATVLSKPEVVTITNVAAPAVVTSVPYGGVLPIGHNGDTRVLHAIMRIMDYSTDANVSGVVVSPMSRAGTAVLGNYAIINPLEKETDVFLIRREHL